MKLILATISLALIPFNVQASMNPTPPPHDAHSYANPQSIRVTHVDLDLTVSFEKKSLEGTAMLDVERVVPGSGPLILDTRALRIARIEASENGRTWADAKYSLGGNDAILGAPLSIDVPAKVRKVRITYSTSPEASGLQWLEPSMTAGKKSPFLFSQSQAIHARSWIPVQDSPSVRMTYTARLRTPKDLFAVMSAENDANLEGPRDGDYTFRMRQAIPAYLIALAVGDIAFKSMSKRTGVFAEPSVVEAAAAEFNDTEKMMVATEKLYGPYRWGRYDILVLPPSFPFGGMENPRVTFATPTVLAGDKSLVALIAHELAHSWSGNLVTNATWDDVWLNEGFTVYVERRIVEEIYGLNFERMEAVLGRQLLQENFDSLEDRDELLHIQMEGRDPDEESSLVPYEKGALFLRHLEDAFGRARFDRFLRGYFDHFNFKSVTTADFEAYLKANLLDKDPAAAAKVPVGDWIHRPGVPESAPKPQSDAFVKVEAAARPWLDGVGQASSIDARKWTTQEWLHFLKYLPQDIGSTRMAELDAAFGFTRSGNAEIEFEWLRLSIKNSYTPADERLEQYLVRIGRRKLIKPLYEELVKTEGGKKRAVEIYTKARPGYHPMAVATVDAIVGWGK